MACGLLVIFLEALRLGLRGLGGLGQPTLARRRLPVLSQQISRQDEQELSEEELAAVETIISKYGSRPGSLIPVLEEIQEEIGYLPKCVQRKVAEGLGLPLSEVYGVVTFYSFFTMVPRGRHTIRVCLGTACYVRGSKKIMDDLCSTLKIRSGQTTSDRRFSLETVRCLGACGLAPAMVVDDDTFGQVKPTNLNEILASYV